MCARAALTRLRLALSYLLFFSCFAGGLDAGAASESDALLTFSQNLRAASLEVDVLRLPDGVFWYGKPDRGSCLYVRPCYLELYDILGSAGMAVLLGSPGIGKSTAVFRILCGACCARMPSASLRSSSPARINGDTFFHLDCEPLSGFLCYGFHCNRLCVIVIVQDFLASSASCLGSVRPWRVSPSRAALGAAACSALNDGTAAAAALRAAVAALHAARTQQICYSPFKFGSECLWQYYKSRKVFNTNTATPAATVPSPIMPTSSSRSAPQLPVQRAGPVVRRLQPWTGCVRYTPVGGR